MALTGNKGEWSEIYVLVSLLADGKLFQSDINLEKDYNNIYEIVKAYKSEGNYNLEFGRTNKVSLYRFENEIREYITSFTLDELKDISRKLYEGIRDGKGKTFKIVEVDNFLNKASISKLKAESSSKSDLKLRIYDHRLAIETDLGFSIKSLIGGDSTLFNTGPGNNFIYRIEDRLDSTVTEFNKRTYITPNRISKITYRLTELAKMDCKIQFEKIQSYQLWKNLKMIDGDLPDIMAYSLYYKWIYRLSSLVKVSELLELNDPLNFYNNQPSEQKLYDYKIKRFLTECAMGMTSEKPWHGEYDSIGGVIIAKNDGDIVCFHIYDFNLFRNYLINNTVFEQASTGEDKSNPGFPREEGKKYYYGWLYKEMDSLFFKINLQIRFR
jgi:hypothetical protein